MMDEKLIQRTRYLLHARVRRVKKCHNTHFEITIKQLLKWLEAHPIFNPIMCHIELIESDIANKIKNFQKSLDPNDNSMELIKADTFEEHIYLCLNVLKMCSDFTGSGNRRKEHNFYTKLIFMLAGQQVAKLDDQLELIKDIALEDLFEYLDEQIDSRNTIYGLLLKYKQRCEWFNVEKLIRIADVGIDGPKGERGLAKDLQEYIFNQGVEFTVEPASPRGEIDLVLKDTDGRYLLLDAKYIKDESGRSEIVTKLRDGFHQVSVYCNEYNEPDGFLVVFVRTSDRISIDLEEMDGVRFLKIGGKTIYYHEILISSEPSASKVGKAKEINVSIAELKSIINEDD